MGDVANNELARDVRKRFKQSVAARSIERGGCSAQWDPPGRIAARPARSGPMMGQRDVIADAATRGAAAAIPALPVPKLASQVAARADLKLDPGWALA
jgi:hypothetical protein